MIDSCNFPSQPLCEEVNEDSYIEKYLDGLDTFALDQVKDSIDAQVALARKEMYELLFAVLTVANIILLYANTGASGTNSLL